MMNKELLEIELEELLGLIRIHEAIIEELELDEDNLVLKSAVTRRKNKVKQLMKEVHALELALKTKKAS